MSVVILGANGQLGTALQEIYPMAICVDTDLLDITDTTAVKNFSWDNVNVVINAAAYTDVDTAETDGFISAWRINAFGVANLAKVSRDRGFTLVHVSTDYVFDGSKPVWNEEDSFNPLSVYGQTKAAGDLAAMSSPRHYIIRTSWVIGNGKNFVQTMLKLGAEKDRLTVVEDQIGRPTFTSDLANGIKHLLESNASFGTYNLTNDGKSLSWADLANKIFEIFNLNCKVIGISTEEYLADKPHTATRPKQSTLALDKIKQAGFTPRNWQIALEKYLERQTS